MENKDIEKILDEQDGKELYETATEVKSAFAHTHHVNVDVDKEWAKFAAKHQQGNWFSRFRAVAACALLVIGIAVAAVAPSFFPKSDAPAEAENAGGGADVAEMTEGNVMLFHDVTLDEILDKLSTLYDAEVICSNEEALQLRLYTQIDRNATLSEALDVLNHFEQVNLRLDEENRIIVE